MFDPAGRAAATAASSAKRLSGAELGGQPPSRFRQSAKLLAAAGISATLLAISGMTLAGTLVLLVLATPAVVVFSHVLVKAAAAARVAAVGLLLGSALGMAGALVLSWVYAHAATKRPRLRGADQFEAAIAAVG